MLSKDASCFFPDTSKLSSRPLVAVQLSHQSALDRCVNACFLRSSSLGSCDSFSLFGSLSNSASGFFEISAVSLNLLVVTACFRFCHTWALLPVIPTFRNVHGLRVLSGLSSTPPMLIIDSPILGNFP